MTKTLSDSERSLLDGRVAETEKATGAQIVLASIARSDSYAEIPWKAFAIGTSVTGLVMLFLDLYVLGWMTNFMIIFSLAVILAAGALSALLTILFPACARWFLSSGRREMETMQYAESLFLSNELFSTKGRRGVLLLVSRFERQVVILPDTGIRDRLSLEVLQGLISEMSMHLGRNELVQAMETGLDGIRSALGPPDPGWEGGNELSDDIIEEEGV